MMVMGMRQRPAEARATAPVRRFARLERRGREEEEAEEAGERGLGRVDGWFSSAGMKGAGRWRWERATRCRRALREEKYRAEPRPVRMTDGRVPRQSWRRGVGPEVMEWKVWRREVDGDCCTRVLRRSAGWRREAERMPMVRPARKWNATQQGGIRVSLRRGLEVGGLYWMMVESWG